MPGSPPPPARMGPTPRTRNAAPAPVIDLSHDDIDLTLDDSESDEAPALGKRKTRGSSDQPSDGRTPPALRGIVGGEILPSPLDPGNLEEPSRFIRDRIMGRILSDDVLKLPLLLREKLLEDYTPGYGLYALHTRDHARKSIAQLKKPRQPAEELRDIIRIDVPPFIAAKIIAIADLAAAYIWGCLPNRVATVPGPYNPARDIVSVAESEALTAIAEISLMVAHALWGQHTSYAVQIQRSELFEPGYDVSPYVRGVDADDLCVLCGSLKSHAVRQVLTTRFSSMALKLS
ncbi:hypothetical protein C8F01DRAFT_1087958 [Mycena amicta]|nr:hypothetical protein C8F01DRAFT_1087958 [Mycena amicta]